MATADTDTPTKRRPYKGAKPGPKLMAGTARTVKIDFRCTPEYKEWVEKVAALHGLKPAQLIGQGLIAFATLSGIEEPPIR